MNTSVRPQLTPRSNGFTMIEMIGVLAIIAILAVIVVPKVFSTIASSRVTSAVASINAMRTAVTEFGARYGTIPVTGNNSRIDDLLIAANMLDNRFMVKIGVQPAAPIVPGATWANTTGTWVATGGSNQTGQTRLLCQTSTTTIPSTAAGRNFRLSGGTTDLPAGSRVTCAVLVNVTIAEARDLSLRIDGDPLSTTAAQAAAADNDGKVVYAAPNAAGTTVAYVYLAHQ